MTFYISSDPLSDQLLLFIEERGWLGKESTSITPPPLLPSLTAVFHSPTPSTNPFQTPQPLRLRSPELVQFI